MLQNRLSVALISGKYLYVVLVINPQSICIYSTFPIFAFSHYFTRFHIFAYLLLKDNIINIHKTMNHSSEALN